ncbi:hypothetical protein AVEN_255149-1 [Araneus ventricosus]|uniref:RNase H type-1 domain-containing protein n=1 Tax=Araneus ventricosus TaxID=182803 RepID=A0A4Y2BB30_ARAVE|nr:hypothetical protein AVEN_255149-1 [Araneus ventricosus]
MPAYNDSGDEDEEEITEDVPTADQAIQSIKALKQFLMPNVNQEANLQKIGCSPSSRSTHQTNEWGIFTARETSRVLISGALKAAIEWGNTANEDVNIWSDSESSLLALKSFNLKSKITQEAQMTLLENARIRLGWVKSHIGLKGNEIADTLAKEATTDGTPDKPSIPKKFPKETTSTALTLALAS